MLQNKKWVEPSLRALVSLFYIHICMAALINILLSPVQFTLYSSASILMYVFLRFITGTKIGKYIGIALSIPVLLTLFFVLIDDNDFREEFFILLGEFGRAWEKLLYFEPLINTRYEVYIIPIVLVLTAVTVLAVWFLHEKKFRFVGLTFYSMFCIILSLEMSGNDARIPFIFLCALSVSTYAGSIFERRRREGVENKESGAGKIMLQALPVALIVLVVSFAFQKQEEPLRWDWLDRQATEIITRIEERFTHTDTEFFSLSATGFGGREHILGGRVRLSNTFVMEVRAEKRGYLRGASYREYSGRSWIRPDPSLDYLETGISESSDDLSELGKLFSIVPPALLFRPFGEDEPEPSSGYYSQLNRVGFKRADQEDLVNALAEGKLAELLFPQMEMDIIYRNMTTRTLFTPLRTIQPLQTVEGADVLVQENSRGIFLARNFLGNGSRYILEYRQTMYGDKILHSLLPLSDEGLYGRAIRSYLIGWREAVEAAAEGRTEDIDLKLVAPNLANYQDASPLEITVSAAVAYLLNNRNPVLTPTYQRLVYWSQRARNIHEQYIALPLTVTERTRQLAIDLTEGIETDYEKAIAIRDYLRTTFPYTLIMPRLPEDRDFVDWFLFEQQSGYCTSYATAMAVMLRLLGIPTRYVEGYVLPEIEPDEDVFRVTNRFAHAWTEVYLEGFGWMSFEPTPGFADATETMIQSEQDVSRQLGASAMSDLEELMRRYGQNREFDELSPVSYVPGVTRQRTSPLNRALIAMFILLLAVVGADLGSRLFEAIRIGRSTARRKVVYRYLKMLDWLSLADMVLLPGESLPEYSARIDKEYYFPESSFSEISELFSRVRYGAKEPSALEVLLVKNMAKELKAQLVIEIGIRRFMPLRHLFIGI